MTQDLRYSVRKLLNQPAFTASIVLIITLGVGATTALFSVIEAILLRQLPFRDPERLVYVEDFGMLFSSSPQHLPLEKETTEVFEQVATYELSRVTFGSGNMAGRINVLRVSPDFFSMLGIPPALGRAFSGEDQKVKLDQVAVISYGLWQTRFGGDPQLLDKTVTLNGRTVTIIGVMPSNFYFYGLREKADAWIPLVPTDPQAPQQYVIEYGTFARLKLGLSLAQASANIDTIAQRVVRLRPELSGLKQQRVRLVSLQEKWVGDLRVPLLLLFGAMGSVLLTACMNITNLLLARGASRQKEVAIRAALGASRFRIIRQSLIESSLLTLLGGVSGLFLANWSVKAITTVGFAHIPRIDEVGINTRVAIFTLAISLITGVLFGLIPALQLSKPDLHTTLKEGGVRSVNRFSPRFRSMVIVMEIAVALVLTLNAGLLIKSFRLLLDKGPGFDFHNVLTLELSPMETRYTDEQQRPFFDQQIITHVRRLPGILHVGTIDYLPISSGSFIIPVNFQERPLPPELPLSLTSRVASSDYFRAIGIPLIAGRYFTEDDGAQSVPVAIIEQTVADILEKYVFPNESVIGKHLILNPRDPKAYEIVGVIGDIKHQGLETRIYPAFYLHAAQRPTPYASLVIRTAVDPADLITPVRNAIWEIDKNQAVYSINILEQQIMESVSRRRSSMFLVSIFAAIALLLAVIGIYGLVAYTVEQRTQEIGIRLVLGAQPIDVLKLVVGNIMILATIGVTLGLIAALTLGGLLSSFLHGISSTDLTTLASDVFLLITIVLLASYIPTRRAMRVDPAISIRHE